MRTCPTCNTKRYPKSAQGVLRKKEHNSGSNKSKLSSFATTVKKKNKSDSGSKHALGFMQMCKISSGKPSDDNVEMADFNFSAVGTEDIHQDPRL